MANEIRCRYKDGKLVLITSPNFVGAKLIKLAKDKYGEIKELNVKGDAVTIGTGCFSKCKEIEKVVLNEGIKVIGGGAFSDTDLKNIHLPSTLENIDDYAFGGCKNLKHIELNEGLSRIGEYAFYSSGLESIDLPSTISFISDDAFKHCKFLRCISIPEGVIEIGDSAFAFSGLDGISLPSTLKRIGYSCFAHCNFNDVITIPEGVVELGKYAFEECIGEGVVLPSTLNVIDDESFAYSSFNNIEIKEGINRIGNKCFANSLLTKIKFPSTIEYFGDNLFYGCKNIKNVELSEGIKFLGKNMFSNSGIEEIVLPSTLSSVNGAAFENTKQLESVIIKNGVKSIGIAAFSGSSLRKISIPPSVETIEKEAFSLCRNLEYVELKDGIKEIKTRAFSNSSLKEIRIPLSIKSISSEAFVWCENLEKIIFFDDDKEIVVDHQNKQFIFTDCDELLMYDCESKKYSCLDDGKYVEFNADDLLKKANGINDVRKLEKYDYINLYHWSKRNKFLPHYTIIKNMPFNEIDKFYMNNNCNKWAEIVKKADYIDDIDKVSLFKLCFVLGVFQENGKARDKAVEFIKEHIIDKMNEAMVHSYFDGFDISNGYNQMYAEFFMKYFKYNRNFMYDYSRNIDFLSASYNNFDMVKLVYPHKVVNTNTDNERLMPYHVMNAVSSRRYSKVDDKNSEFAINVGKYGYTQQQFETLQNWFNIGKGIKKEDLKIFISDDNGKESDVTYELLEKNNPLNAVLGNITNCCQMVGSAGESCVEYGMTRPNSKFMTFNFNKEIIGQAWVWYDPTSKTVCLDNIEVPHRFVEIIDHNKRMQNSFLECLYRVGDNFVSEMEKNGLKVNKVTIGKGYNDIRFIIEKQLETNKNSKKLMGYLGYSDASDQFILKNNKK